MHPTPDIRASSQEIRIKRYELTDAEWSIIRSHLPDCHGPYSTCYNRFNRWRKAGIRDGILAAMTGSRDAEVQMLDTPIVRVHQHASRQ